MKEEFVPNKQQDEQQALSQAIEGLQQWLTYAAKARETAAENKETASPPWPLPIAPDSAVFRIQQAFDLSDFEIGVILLAVAIELYPQLEAVIAQLNQQLNGRSDLHQPTFSLALSILPEAHWDAIENSSPLRHFRLIRLGPGEILTRRPLYIEERVLHTLMGFASPDPRLLKRFMPLPIAATISPASQVLARQGLTRLNNNSYAILQLSGKDEAARREMAAYMMQQIGVNGFRLRADWLPSDPVEQMELLRLWARETGLSAIGLLLEMPNTHSPELELAALAFLEKCQGCVFLSRYHLQHLATRPVINIEIPALTFKERVQLWQVSLPAAMPLPDDKIQTIAAQFSLSAQEIAGAADEVRSHLAAQASNSPMDPPIDPLRLLWTTCRKRAQPQLAQLVQPVNVQATFTQLVLPELQRRTLQALISQVRQKAKVHHSWGFAEKHARGGGVAAIFAGPSGTGKTMAAEAIAHELDLDLYRIDLSAVVSKYIGETEENLRRVFDAAEIGGAILLFDEADSLFGKRTEVRDSHDRHANIEVSYLLQRMESYGGLAILTTNLRKSVDDAFLRRMQFIAEFPFPDAAIRQQIWQGIFPAATPCEGLDFAQLARLSVAGGNIKSIAQNAAYLAADAGRSVTMADLLESARLEYIKLNRTIPPSEIKEWLSV